MKRYFQVLTVLTFLLLCSCTHLLTEAFTAKFSDQAIEEFKQFKEEYGAGMHASWSIRSDVDDLKTTTLELTVVNPENLNLSDDQAVESANRQLRNIVLSGCENLSVFDSIYIHYSFEQGHPLENTNSNKTFGFDQQSLKGE